MIKRSLVAPSERITGNGREYDDASSLRLYLKQIAETPLLTRAEEITLARRIATGDADAREHMIRANLRLVVRIAKDYMDNGLPFLDLINEGNIGLMRAVERFDPDKGAKLSTYAAWWIKQCIKRALSNKIKQIRIPIHLVQHIFRLRRAENTFEAKHGRPASDSELAIILSVTEDDIEHWRESSLVGTVSLDTPLSNEPDGPVLADIIPDEEVAMPWGHLSESTNAELVQELVSTLDKRQQYILTRRFGLDDKESETLESIGEKLKVTRERIRQIEATALRKLYRRLQQRTKGLTH